MRVGVVLEHYGLLSMTSNDTKQHDLSYDLGYFDEETCRLEPIENPFAAKVLPMCPE